MCQQIVRRHARTFWVASHFLTPEKRRSAFALYAFCRVADDLVDLAGPLPPDEIARRLELYRRRLDDALAGRTDDPLFRELQRAVHLHGVPPAVLHALLDGVARDGAPTSYESWPELERYCAGVASTVGEMCTHVFGVASTDAATRERALHHARTLGVAMQLTNILRDVGEDARRGRCYLPERELERFGIRRDEVLHGIPADDPRWQPFMRFQIARARALYAEASPGIALLAPDARRCAAACAKGYAGILDAIEAIGYDTFVARARLGSRARARVLWNAWRRPIETTPVRSEGTWLRWIPARPR